MHCLRSKFILEHKPAQAIYAAGKEHLMRANPAIGPTADGWGSDLARL